jgi:hypothetical protein
MTDNLKDRGPADRSRVNTGEAWEVTYWSKRFGCTPEQLKAAVVAVGSSAEKVEAYLKRQPAAGGGAGQQSGAVGGATGAMGAGDEVGKKR